MKYILHPLVFIVLFFVLITILEMMADVQQEKNVNSTIRNRNFDCYTLDNGMDVNRYLDKQEKYIGWKVTDCKDTFEIVRYKNGKLYASNGLVINEKDIGFYRICKNN